MNAYLQNPFNSNNGQRGQGDGAFVLLERTAGWSYSFAAKAIKGKETGGLSAKITDRSLFLRLVFESGLCVGIQPHWIVFGWTTYEFFFMEIPIGIT